MIDFIFSDVAYAYIDPNTGGFFFQTIAPFVYGVLGVILLVIPFWKIFKKAGYNGAWSLLTVIPLINLIVIFIFAFSKWPVLKDMARLRGINNG